MTTQHFLDKATESLARAGIETARLDTLVLLEDSIGRDRAYLLAHPDAELTTEQYRDLYNKIVRRSRHEPLAYIRGKALFYGRTFMVNDHVLVPRPETETIISLLRTLPLQPRPSIADVGTGSGCLGITAALEWPGATIHLYDIDPDALAVAAHNAQAYHIRAHWTVNDLLRGVHEQYDVILANLPYVPEDLPINRAASFEPKIAIFAGKDGLDLYRHFWKQIEHLDHPPRFIITEALPLQHQDLTALAKSVRYTPVKTEGFIQVFARTSP